MPLRTFFELSAMRNALAKDFLRKTDGVYKINGSWYAFADDGSMHANWASNQYRAKADGSLYCSEWYQDSNKKWQYILPVLVNVLPVCYYASALIFAYNCFLTK